jgi:hypothetical protein
MEVYDAMARHGQTNVWRISPTGEVANQACKEAKVADVPPAGANPYAA